MAILKEGSKIGKKEIATKDDLIIVDKTTSQKYKYIVEDGKPYLEVIE